MSLQNGKKRRELVSQFVANAARAYKANDLATSNRIEFDAVQTFDLCSAKVFGRKLKTAIAERF
jgi:hypothetical protein